MVGRGDIAAMGALGARFVSAAAGGIVWVPGISFPGKEARRKLGPG